MRVAVVGPGAIGGLFGMRLALSGVPVTFIAHGATLEAIRVQGLTLIEVDGTSRHLAHVNVTDSMTAAGPHDVVLLTVKAQQVSALAGDLRAMIGPETIVVTMENGLPWWYFLRGYAGSCAGQRLESVDPGGVIAKHLDPACIIGAVEYVAARHVSLAEVAADGGSQIILGELDGRRTERIERLATLLGQAGFDAPVTSEIRSEIWRKLLINVSLNPVTALTHATIGEACRMPESRQLIIDVMKEAEAVAEATGIQFDVSPETRMAVIEKFGSHKTSMLQDVESGRPAEVEPLVGALVELGRLVRIPTARTETAYALMKSLDKTLMTIGGRLDIQEI